MFKVKNKDEKEINIDSMMEKPMKHCQVEVKEKYFWTSFSTYMKIR